MLYHSMLVYSSKKISAHAVKLQIYNAYKNVITANSNIINTINISSFSTSSSSSSSTLATAIPYRRKSKYFPQILVDYASLSKLRLSSLVVITTGAGFICGSSPIDIVSLSFACFGTMLCASSAATFNQIMEKDCDAAMNRTKSRPLPSGRVSMMNATIWGFVTGVTGTGILYTMLNPMVAGLGLANILLYTGPYTISKKYSEINTWLGSLVGAIPPVMGWAAATGGSIYSLEPLALGSVLFLWQFPHFFALSWLHRDDYAKGGFQMVAVNDPDGTRSAYLIMEYSVYLAILPLATSLSGLTSYMFAVEGTVVNGYLLYLAHRFKSDHSNANARRIFLCSLWYLPLLLGAYVLHSNHFQTMEETKTDEITKAMVHAKETLKGLCMHEVIVHQEVSNQQPQLCPKVVTDKTVSSIGKKSQEIVQNRIQVENVPTEKSN